MFVVCGELFRNYRAIKQGNPLSTVLFHLVVGSVLETIPAVNFYSWECRPNVLMYADIFLFASSKQAMQSAFLTLTDYRLITETNIHIIHGYVHTHDGRVLIHNAMYRTMTSGLVR
jgi:hypothetical protein